MVVFRQKKIITTKSLGENLQKRRQQMNLTILGVEKKIGIISKYLEALENNEYEIIPGEIYARNFLKKYSHFLGLNWDKIATQFKEDLVRQNVWQSAVQTKFGLTKKKLIVLPKILRNSFIAFGVMIVVAYLGFHLWSLLGPPRVKILYPEDKCVLSGKSITILGKTEPNLRLFLNGQEFTVGEQGFFEVDINLNTGLNIVKIEAEKRFGQKKAVYRHIIIQ